MMTLNEYIEDTLIAEGLYDPSIFKAIFLAGGPGSGKSFMVRMTALKAMGFTVINSDLPFEILMRKLDLDFKMPESEKEQRDIIREKAKSITDKRLELALRGRLGLVIDGTGKDAEKIMKMRGKLAVYGYESALIFINTDLETALARNAKRDRTVPEQLATELWKDVQRNLGLFQRAFGINFHIIDNSEDMDVAAQTNSVYKRVSDWAKLPSRNGVAQKWIQDQKQRRNINEATYAGNIGVMELVKFQQVATDEEKKHLKNLISNRKTKDAWDLVQTKLGVKLVGKSFGN